MNERMNCFKNDSSLPCAAIQTDASDGERRTLVENSSVAWFIWRAFSCPLGGKTQFSLEDINGALISWENSSDEECCVPEFSAGAKITRLHMRN